jgi:nifR3 family TIM-barrel protein
MYLILKINMKSFPKLKNKLILAPMEDVTSLPFRLLCRKYKVAMAYTPQTSALALTRENQKSIRRIETNKEDKPVGLQLFGRNPDILIEAAKKYGKNFDVIDLNFGCPSKKIVKQGYGSALLKEKERIFDIVSSLTNNLNKPITVKMRSGFKKVEALELVKVIEKAGAAAITIHARTKVQGYSGKADWSVIKKAKEAINIPIIGNGDVRSGKDAEEMLKIADYCMIGRAARDNPMIFKNILDYFETGLEKEFSIEDRLKIFEEYLNLENNLKLIKARAIDWTKGLKNSARLRAKLQKARNIEEIREIFYRIRNLRLI